MGDQGHWNNDKVNSGASMAEMEAAGYYNAPCLISRDTAEVRALAEKHGEDAVWHDWMRQVYEMMGDGVKGGPMVKDAWKIMLDARVQVVDSPAELVALLQQARG
jgi:hypothetical protein